jgi:hypothetical protein
MDHGQLVQLVLLVLKEFKVQPEQPAQSDLLVHQVAQVLLEQEVLLEQAE